jgi:uncharacterized protein (TIGR02246 family)
MSKKILALVILTPFVFLSACQEQGGGTQQLDTKQKANIEKAVLQTLEEYFAVIARRDVKRFLSFFVDTEDMTVIEDKEIRPSRKAFEEFAVGFFKDIVEISVTWEERRVFPLSNEVAVATGIFRISAKMTSGDTAVIRNAFTFVFVKKGDRWQIKHVHESSMLA